MITGLTILFFALLVVAHFLHVRGLRLEHEADLISAKRAGHRDGYSIGYNEAIKQHREGKR